MGASLVKNLTAVPNADGRSVHVSYTVSAFPAQTPRVSFSIRLQRQTGTASTVNDANWVTLTSVTESELKQDTPMNYTDGSFAVGTPLAYRVQVQDVGGSRAASNTSPVFIVIPAPALARPPPPQAPGSYGMPGSAPAPAPVPSAGVPRRGLSGGAIAGIVIASVVGAGLLIGIGRAVMQNSRARRERRLLEEYSGARVVS